MPKVSVIMNCRDCSRYLREAIDSVYAQTFTDWEIIFWDNRSTDESPAIAKSYDGRLRYFRGGESLPLGAARNEAVKRAEGRLIAFLDCDDVWMPRHLELLFSALTDDAVLAYGGFITRDMESGREYMPFVPEREFHSGRVTRHLCKKNFIWLQAVLVRAEAVRRLPYAFDSALLTAEDFDFILRVSLEGGFRHVAEPTFYYRMHGSNITSSKRHYFAHDFSYLLEKYKGVLERPMLRDLARQYLLTVRLDLNAAGFRVFPFFRLGLSLRQMIISLLFVLFPGTDILALKAKLRRPLDVLLRRGHQGE